MNVKYTAPLALVAMIGFGSALEMAYVSESGKGQDEVAILSGAAVGPHLGMATAQDGGGAAAAIGLVAA